MCGLPYEGDEGCANDSIQTLNSYLPRQGNGQAISARTPMSMRMYGVIRPTTGCDGDNPICNAATVPGTVSGDDQCGGDAALLVAAKPRHWIPAGCNAATEITHFDGEPQCLPTNAENRCVSAMKGVFSVLDCSARDAPVAPLASVAVPLYWDRPSTHLQ